MLLRHIRYLLAVAEHRNFTRAAEALHVSQPTLSQQIKQLEESLGAPLLDRTGRRISLTDAGQAYVRYARLALQDLQAGTRAIHDVQDLRRGHLRLAMTPTFTAYLIGPLLARFNALYPGITLSIEELTQDRIEAALGEDLLDIGIGFTGEHGVEIDCEALFVEELSLVVSASHPERNQRAWLEQPLVLLNTGFATRRYIDDYCHRQGVKPQIAMEANSISAIIEIVRSTPLATILPRALAEAQAGLRAVAIEPALPQRTAALLSRKGAYRSAACAAFVALIKA
ncbi:MULTISPECIES: transcriptional regulator CynR [Pseudomonas]|uniref:Transcriptional regulator CynR n=1 Tax=Pseudomonas lactis TaxID=1615674 RepID=A0A219A016_9PSED|nr:MULTISPECIES: transcriptional regulator CynR [Pseudomonas]TKK08448.1 transcriptional regulator CynR [Pseudomonas fluorescens]KRP78164.1 transcriptional regulator [Pseudomonas lactis]MBI6977014.1 transcriptional regulator CynR [Pseudomonas lactis]MCF4972377.1 transcriptional regulator CynR [Pseudomonas lactis]MCF5001150.1 transcriptional regulator CynR [Pseudomonas lactis]